jgi:hypothetical protein
MLSIVQIYRIFEFPRSCEAEFNSQSLVWDSHSFVWESVKIDLWYEFLPSSQCLARYRAPFAAVQSTRLKQGAVARNGEATLNSGRMRTRRVESRVCECHLLKICRKRELC